MSLKFAIKSNPAIKALVYKLIIKNARPQWWVRNIVTPFIYKRGRKSSIRRTARMDVLPFNNFSLGQYSTIEDFCTVNNGVGDVIIGDNTRVGIGNVVIGPVNIGNQVILAQNIVLSGLNHTYTDVNTPIRLQKVTTANIVIEDEVWIGANSVITAGVTIGRHSVVAGGSVVTKNVPAFCVVGGNPAKILKRYNQDTSQWERT
ncbi:acyltransferase [Mucilaginibacter celer]|uniref:Acyltransferase n=1 Tax=Mucilaginibacter celer TaxID=2305508 RepID=A0A494VJF1_9SPHI|nr:acyltransferase [Mucilaginibacter celer]AYL95156.1 acyltransferase [Mucilaginibacter celer]